MRSSRLRRPILAIFVSLSALAASPALAQAPQGEAPAGSASPDGPKPAPGPTVYPSANPGARPPGPGLPSESYCHCSTPGASSGSSGAGLAALAAAALTAVVLGRPSRRRREA